MKGFRLTPSTGGKKLLEVLTAYSNAGDLELELPLGSYVICEAIRKQGKEEATVRQYNLQVKKEGHIIKVALKADVVEAEVITIKT